MLARIGVAGQLAWVGQYLLGAGAFLDRGMPACRAGPDCMLVLLTNHAFMDHIFDITVEFGDCDPSGIVFHPNFFSWFDAASLHYFREAGVPPWRETSLTHGIVGTPIVSTRCDFRAPARYGDRLRVLTRISEWGRRSFTQHHRIVRGEVLITEAFHVRVFAAQDPNDPERIRAVAIPDEFRALCDRRYQPTATDGDAAAHSF
jgi:4-hydroxybenzoyl-CoA thioesterase